MVHDRDEGEGRAARYEREPHPLHRAQDACVTHSLLTSLPRVTLRGSMEEERMTE